MASTATKKKVQVAKPKKAARKRRVSDSESDLNSSDLSLSDDDGYSAVEDISDADDEDDEDVAAAEEESILKESGQASPRPVVAPLYMSDEDDADDADQSDGHENESDVDVEQDQDQEHDISNFDDNASWSGVSHHQETADEAAPERRVHFDLPDSSDEGSATEDEMDSLYPDIFVPRQSLDPVFRREIDAEQTADGFGAYWDLQENDEIPIFTFEQTRSPPPDSQQAQAEAPVVPDWAAIKEESDSDDDNLDGYETDGETTEDEDEPEPIVQRKRRPSMSSVKSVVSETEDEDMEEPTKGQPRTRRINLNRNHRKPIAVLNPHTRKMMIFTPQSRRDTDTTPEEGSPSVQNFDESELMSLWAQPGNMMLSGMLGTDANGFGNIGPAEAFFPANELPGYDYPSVLDQMGVFDDSESYEEMGSEQEDEQQLDISDFIAFGDDGSSADEREDRDPSGTPARPTTASSSASLGNNGPLSHLNPATVGAFRQNQINQQLILSNQATSDSLAFSEPYNTTTVKGLKSDRFDTAAAPLTPARRQKRNIGEDYTKSPLESAGKRKASVEADGSRHRKQRSISDVNNLRI